MALQYKAKQSVPDERTLELNFGTPNGYELTKTMNSFFPSEWYPQSGVQLTWPHAGTDWRDMLPEVTTCYLRMAYEIASREPLLIVTPEPENVRQTISKHLPENVRNNIRLVECPTNDTWARDHGFITMFTEDGPALLDFCFNGWGMKFAANEDNRINRRLADKGIFNGTYVNSLDFVFEGGSIESDGKGTLLTTSACLLSPNRNDNLTKDDIEQRLKQTFNARQVLWLDSGYLSGDDTDSHIDTLARLCPNDTITYVQCTDPKDEHYDALKKMEAQLETFRTLEGVPYHLVPLPLPDAIYDSDGLRLPATYANYLIINNAVLVPVYDQPANDEKALRNIRKIFPEHTIVGIDCRVLIRQHGSLHCCTMQFPATVLNQ